MTSQLTDLGQFILNYDPLEPQLQFLAATAEMPPRVAPPLLPEPIPWPPGQSPIPVHPTVSAPADPLPQVDVVVVTWTVAEARAMAALFTPGVQLEQWLEYEHNVPAFIPRVTGTKAPFNDRQNIRYYHSLGLYYQCQIGQANVLCFKSGLHFAYDGSAVPVTDLWNQIIDETQARVIITTGTGGGIGANIKLGDVIIARDTVFDCTRQFKDAPFAHSSYTTSDLPGSPVVDVTAAMLKPNGDKLDTGGRIPQIVYPGSESIPAPKIVTTDTFAYDDTNDSAGLQQLGNVCDMGDAVLGRVIQSRGNPPIWAAVRNASDPQMDGSLPKAKRDEEAKRIYEKYGLYTTVGSLLATWGIIRVLVPAATQPLSNASQNDGARSTVDLHQ